MVFQHINEVFFINLSREWSSPLVDIGDRPQPTKSCEEKCALRPCWVDGFFMAVSNSTMFWKGDTWPQNLCQCWLLFQVFFRKKKMFFLRWKWHCSYFAPLHGKFFGQVCIPAAIWLANMNRNLVIMAMMFGKQAPRSWKYLEESPKPPDICRYLRQSVSFLMVVTQQGCWTKHIHHYFDLAMSKCRHASYKIGRWKETHLQKEETDSSQWKDRPRKRSWRNIYRSSVSFAIMWTKVWGSIFVSPGAPHHKETWKILFTFFEISLSSLGCVTMEHPSDSRQIMFFLEGFAVVPTKSRLPIPRHMVVWTIWGRDLGHFTTTWHWHHFAIDHCRFLRGLVDFKALVQDDEVVRDQPVKLQRCHNGRWKDGKYRQYRLGLFV